VAGERFDVVVLGGGAAGCVIAARLSEDADRSVCLVEAGPDYGPLVGGGWPADLLDANQLPVSHDWHYDDGFGWSARVIGGCSAHNACMLTWGAGADYDEWGEGWSADGLHAYRLRAEQAIGAVSGGRESAWNDAVLTAAAEVGYPVLDDLSDEHSVRGVGRAPLNVRDGVRRNAAFAYLDAARGRPNLTIVDGVVADRLEVAGGAVRGAHVIRDGARRLIAAPLVVVAAGAYGSPAILLRSGIGPEAELRRLGITPIAPLLGVGSNLLNHWTARVLLDPGPELGARISAEARAGAVPMGGTIAKTGGDVCEPGLWDMHLAAICWGLRDDAGTPTGEYVLRISTSALRPRSAGRVTLRSADPTELPLIDHRPLSDPDGTDLQTLVEGLRQARRIAQAPSLLAMGVREQPAGPFPADQLDEQVRATLGCYYHPVGTCAIGPATNAATVVDGNGAVHGLQGIHVADASILPTIPRAQTHLTVLAVAERLADLLRGRTRE
jgi:choline dehydrogenase